MKTMTLVEAVRLARDKNRKVSHITLIPNFWRVGELDDIFGDRIDLGLAISEGWIVGEKHEFSRSDVTKIIEAVAEYVYDPGTRPRDLEDRINDARSFGLLFADRL